jgi:hypothetical protein
MICVRRLVCLHRLPLESIDCIRRCLEDSVDWIPTHERKTNEEEGIDAYNPGYDLESGYGRSFCSLRARVHLGPR